MTKSYASVRNQIGSDKWYGIKIDGMRRLINHTVPIYGNLYGDIKGFNTKILGEIPLYDVLVELSKEIHKEDECYDNIMILLKAKSFVREDFVDTIFAALTHLKRVFVFD